MNVVLHPSNSVAECPPLLLCTSLRNVIPLPQLIAFCVQWLRERLMLNILILPAFALCIYICLVSHFPF